jgi:hypothetical protein
VITLTLKRRGPHVMVPLGSEIIFFLKSTAKLTAHLNEANLYVDSFLRREVDVLQNGSALRIDVPKMPPSPPWRILVVI